jgi:hypothetical protein
VPKYVEDGAQLVLSAVLSEHLQVGVLLVVADVDEVGLSWLRGRLPSWKMACPMVSSRGGIPQRATQVRVESRVRRTSCATIFKVC